MRSGSYVSSCWWSLKPSPSPLDAVGQFLRSKAGKTASMVTLFLQKCILLRQYFKKHYASKRKARICRNMLSSLRHSGKKCKHDYWTQLKECKKFKIHELILKAYTTLKVRHIAMLKKRQFRTQATPDPCDVSCEPRKRGSHTAPFTSMAYTCQQLPTLDNNYAKTGRVLNLISSVPRF